MTTPEIAKVKKRDGSIADFEQERITKAVYKALTVTGEGDEKAAEKVSDRVVKILNRRFSKREIPEVEQIQDIVEEVLMLEDLIQTAKSYIIYREQRRRMRETETIYDEAVEIYDKYINEIDWQVKENANMAYSLQGLNNYGVGTLTKRYWLNKIYPQQIREAAASGDFHIHDLDFLGAYCCGWDLYDLLRRGFGGVAGKVESKPPKHLQTALGQVVNFFYTLQGETAGAVAFSNFDTLLAPFIRYDKLEYKQVKQCMQEFLFGCAVPTRVGFQCLSQDTQILSPEGWKKYHEVKVGDTIKTFNIEKGMIENKEVKDVFKKDYQGVMYNLKTPKQDQLISPGHRVVMKNSDSSFAAQTIEDILKTSIPIFVPIIPQGEEIEIDEISMEAIREVEYRGIIWCPNTDNETVIAKRNGQVFITGNTPFSNITVDITPSPSYAKQPVIIGGELQKETYGEFGEEMKVFNKAFFEAMMEGDKNGRVFSVDADCLCPIKNSEKIKLVKIGDYIDKLMEKRKPMFIKENNCEVLDVKDLGIRCLGLKGQKIDWQQVNFLVRHPFEQLLQVQTQGGFNIKLSPSHSVFILQDGQIRDIKALNLRKGDYLISPKTIPAGENKTSVIALAEEFVKKQKAEGIYVSAVLKDGEKYQEKRTALHKRNYGKGEYKYPRGAAVFPLSHIASDIKKFDLSKAELNLAGSALKVKNALPISPELVEFLGWYCAEGSAEKSAKYGGISLGLNLKKERQTAEHIINLIKEIWPGLPVALREIEERNLVEVRIHAKLLRRVITEVFELGNGKKRKVPQIIFELPDEMKKIFLNAYFQGDAWLTENIMVNSISRELIYGVSTLLKQLGVFHTLTEYQWEGRPRWRVNVFRNRDLEVKDSYTISKVPIKESGLEWVVEMILRLKPHYKDSLGRKCENTKIGVFHHFGISYPTSSSTSIKKAQALLRYARELGVKISDLLQGVEADNFSFFRVKKVEETKTSNGMVYDFSTESESFVADQLLVHNTFPIPTVNITHDFPWDEPYLDPMWLATAKYGICYFANFLQSDMKPEEVRSMCIQPDEEMVIRNSHKIKRFSIKEIVENYRNEEFDDEGWAECNKEKNLEVLSLNPNTFKTEWAKVERFFRVPVKKAIEVETEDGKKAIFSDQHPMAVLTEQGIAMKWSKDIKKGDYLLSLKNARENLSQDYQLVDNLVLHEDLASILGYFIADGNYLFENRKGYTHFGEPRGMQFTFKTGDTQNLSLVKNLIKKVFNLDCKEKQDHRYNTYYLYVYNTELARKLYSAGFKKYGRLPQVLFNSPQAVIESFLEFHFKGDGYAKRQEIHINDKDLSRDLTILYSLIGKPVNYRLRKNSQRIYLQHAKRKIKNGNGWLNNPIIVERAPAFLADGWKIPGFNSQKMIGFDTMEKHGAQTPESLKIKNSNIYVARVKAVQEKELEKEQTFYDVELEKNHLFVHSLGLVSFNCCRLRLNNKELLKRGGGLFGANPLTGSSGVVTINMSRLGYLSKTKKEFFERLGRVMDLAKESLEIKRKAIDDLMRKGLYPYSKHYLEDVEKMRGSHYGNHFSTIGILGMNECLLNFMGEDIGSDEGRKFTLETMDFMRDRIIKYQEETGNLYNLESTPAEGASYKLALKDREKYPEIVTAGTKEVPYYTNSTQLPVNYTDDVFRAVELQDDLQCKYSGGCIEKGNKVLTNKGLLPIEDIVKDFKKLEPIKALSYNPQKKVSEWDNIVEAMAIDVRRHNKIRVMGERGLDITTSDWHPFFVMEKVKINPSCPVCKEGVGNAKGFAAHLRWDESCHAEYKNMSKYRVIEKRADELKAGDYILQNSFNLFPERLTQLNNDLAWLLGFFIGDGCLSEFVDNRGGNDLQRYKIRFFSSHSQALNKVAKILNDHFNCQVSVIKNDKRSQVLREVSTSKKEVVEFLFKYGLKAGKKVYDVSIGQEIKDNLNKSNVFSLLSGLMDSDGHIGKKQGDFEYYTVSPRLADDVLEICSMAGIMIAKILKPTKRKNEVDVWRLRIPSYEMTKIKNQLSNKVHSERLDDNFSNRKKRYLPVVRVQGVSKVDVGDNQFYDLTTANNHNYLAGKNSLVFVHNTVLHLFIGEQLRDLAAMKGLIKKIFSHHKLPYITLTPTFSICPSHGYLSGEHWQCPKCTIEQPCEVYSRIVGYIRPVQQWHKGKSQEFKERKTFQAPEATTTL